MRELVEALDRYGRERGLTVRKIAQARVKRTFAVSNKARMARAIAARFPELARCLPPERKPWMSEDLRMAMFDAAAMALILFRIKTPSQAGNEAEISRDFSAAFPQ